MAKGDDAVRKRKNKVNRKRHRNAGESVSARVSAAIAAKRRRKAGKRRICEGMCFTLPTPEDPFNDRWDKKNKPQQNPSASASAAKTKTQITNSSKNECACISEEREGSVSKFLMLCLNAIQDAWAAEDKVDISRPLSPCQWGVELYSSLCAAGRERFNLVKTKASYASREQTAWLVSTASDIITRKEKGGLSIPCPFLLYLVPNQERATQVRSVCKPLKALGIHTVSLHPGASLDHQTIGLKSCEPEFLVSTPKRLLQLSIKKAIDLTGVALLVLDGLEVFLECGLMDDVRSIKEKVSSDSQLVVFDNSNFDVLKAQQILSTYESCK